MAGFNSVVLVGNLCADPKVNKTSSGKCVANLRLAVNERKDQPATFVDVTVWDKGAEFCRDYLTKGRQVLVQGRIATEEWEKDGESRTKQVVIAWQVLGLERNGRNGKEQQNDSVPF